MDPKGNIYESTEENPASEEDLARLNGYLRGRAEADKKAERAEERLKAEL